MDAELRMTAYANHVYECKGICQPLDWHTFKIYVWRIAKGDKNDALDMALRVAKGEKISIIENSGE